MQGALNVTEVGPDMADRGQLRPGGFHRRAARHGGRRHDRYGITIRKQARSNIKPDGIRKFYPVPDNTDIIVKSRYMIMQAAISQELLLVVVAAMFISLHAPDHSYHDVAHEETP